MEKRVAGAKIRNIIKQGVCIRVRLIGVRPPNSYFVRFSSYPGLVRVRFSFAQV